MNFTNPLFLIPFINGIIFIIAGFITVKFPPKKINKHYGYRTRSSMKSQEHWEFSQKYSSKEGIRLGIISILISVLGLFYEPGGTIGIIFGVGLVIVVAVSLFIRTEKAIKRRFRKNLHS